MTQRDRELVDAARKGLSEQNAAACRMRVCGLNVTDITQFDGRRHQTLYVALSRPKAKIYMQALHNAADAEAVRVAASAQALDLLDHTRAMQTDKTITQTDTSAHKPTRRRARTPSPPPWTPEQL